MKKEMATWDIEDFRSWLTEHAPDRVVGYSDHCTSCPLVWWRRERHAEDVSIGAGICVLMDTGEELGTPDWANEFAEALDLRHGEEGEEEFEYRTEVVIAGECLDVLMGSSS